ncbi:MAG: hypothetical protein PHW96_04430 [Candidatus Nanoarchaeia archaeon]|nr:hypothetical protein [Candidatus Nanoarchaeia archaeon]
MESKNWEPVIAMVLIVVAVLILVLVIISSFWEPAVEAGRGSLIPNWY